MLDFEVKNFSRVCAETDREFKPGDRFYSYLIRDGSETVRRDVSIDAWKGPPEDCLGWWKSEVPDPKSKKLNWAPHDVMLHYFGETEDKPDQADVRFILTLLMIRRRIFRLEESENRDDGTEVLHVYCTRNESEYEVPVVGVTAERAKNVQDILSNLLVDAGGTPTGSRDAGSKEA